MRRGAVIVTAASLLALTAPAAVADPPVAECAATVSAPASSQTYEGVVRGYVAHVGSEVSIRCYVTVDGTEVSSSPTGTSPNTVAATAGPVSFTAAPASDVRTCYEVGTTHGTHVACEPVAHVDVPPREVADAVDDVTLTVVDPAVCPALSALAGTYGRVTITSQGDVFLGGEPIKDCPPYDLTPPADVLLPTNLELVGTITIEGLLIRDPDTGEARTTNVVTYGGVFDNQALWYCDPVTTGGGPLPYGRFVVNCYPMTDIAWDCLGAQAVAESRADVSVRIHPDGDVEPAVVWGRVATTAACDTSSGGGSAYSDLADEQQQVRYDAAVFDASAVSQVRCGVGADSYPAEGPYRAACTFP